MGHPEVIAAFRVPVALRGRQAFRRSPPGDALRRPFGELLETLDEEAEAGSSCRSWQPFQGIDPETRQATDQIESAWRGGPLKQREQGLVELSVTTLFTVVRLVEPPGQVIHRPSYSGESSVEPRPQGFLGQRIDRSIEKSRGQLGITRSAADVGEVGEKQCQPGSAAGQPRAA